MPAIGIVISNSIAIAVVGRSSRTCQKSFLHKQLYHTRLRLFILHFPFIHNHPVAASPVPNDARTLLIVIRRKRETEYLQSLTRGSGKPIQKDTVTHSHAIHVRSPLCHLVCMKLKFTRFPSYKMKHNASQLFIPQCLGASLHQTPLQR